MRAYARRYRTQLQIAKLVGFLPLILSCSGSACPLDEVIDIPILTIVTAKNAAAGTAIPEIVLSDIHIEGQLLAGNTMQILATNSRNISIEGDQLRCTIDCGFSASNGHYQFRVSAPGYASKTVDIPAVRYTAFDRHGCTNTATRGTEFAITLDAAP